MPELHGKVKEAFIPLLATCKQSALSSLCLGGSRLLTLRLAGPEAGFELTHEKQS